MHAEYIQKMENLKQEGLLKHKVDSSKYAEIEKKNEIINW